MEKGAYATMDYWFSLVSGGGESRKLASKMYQALAKEIPPILSVVGERTCNLQCTHCIFQAERSSSAIRSGYALTEAVGAIVRQMGPDPIVVHEGRIFRPWHLEWLTAIRKIRPDSHVGMIDNGTFLNHRTEILSSGFRFDWLDISLDGPELVHNIQRNSRQAFSVAIHGIKNAREFVSPGGRVTSLFTLTRYNHASVLDTCRALPAEIDEWHITTLSPARPEIAGLATTDEEFAIAWRQVVSASRERQLFFRIYVNDDLLKLAKAAGVKKLAKALDNAKIADVALLFKLDGVRVIYYPTSVVAGEEVILDADACHRMPYSIAYTLEELRSGKSRFGEDLQKYTVGPVIGTTDLAIQLQMCTSKWKRKFGLAALRKEIGMFGEILKERG